jgi:hypothetical protein
MPLAFCKNCGIICLLSLNTQGELAEGNQKLILLTIINQTFYTMKILKNVLLAIVTIITIPLVVALFVKKEYTVERSVLIEKSNNEVFDYIKYLKNQDEYSVWSKIDPEMKTWYEGIDGTVGFEAFWESENPDAGKGSQQITKIVEGHSVESVIKFIEPFESNANAYMTTESGQAGETIVKWGISGKMPYPLNLMLVVFKMENDIGNDLENGLKNLKVLLEG